MRTFFALVLVTFALSAVAALAPLHGVGLDTIPDEYIVVLNEDLTVEMRDLHLSELQAVLPTVKLINTYGIGKFIGFHAVLDKGALARELEHPDVKYIEANQVVRINADDTDIQSPATWGIDRIDQRDAALDNKYHFFHSQGQGVNAYVVDTGIYCDHIEFKGRCHYGANYITGETNADCNGHGTHVAGTIGGTVYGVAKQVVLYAVKVLSCSGSGSNAGVISGVQWAVNHHTSTKSKASVGNLSLGGGISTALDSAMAEGYRAGVTFAVAAGNSNANACNYSPAREPTCITVGATQQGDARASYSNFGTCLDIFAPGTNIVSAWIGSTTAINTISGTSMASPHVAGAVAIYLGHQLNERPSNPVPTPAAVASYFSAQSSANKVTSPGTGSPNKFLYSPFTAL